MKRKTAAKDVLLVLLALVILVLLFFIYMQAKANEKVTEPSPSVGNGIVRHGHLSVEGTLLVNQEGEPVQLRGMSTHGVTWFPNYVNIGALEFLKEQGANLLRIAMYSDDNDGGYLHSYNEREFNKAIMYIGIENALAAEMYVIADWHLLKDENPLKQTDAAVKFFSELSERYANNQGIIYEICNEPNGDTTWDDIKKYADRVIPAIRKNSPNAIIIVGTPRYSSDIDSVIGNGLAYHNVMYSYHYYTGSSAPYIERINACISAGIPIFVSEWGIRYSDDGTIMSESANEFVDFINRSNISWAAWSFSNSDESYSVIKPDVTELSGWNDDDLTETGKLIFSKMKEPENVRS